MVLAAVGRFAKTHPFKFGCIFSCVKTSFSDWLVQTQIEKRDRVDWKRNGTFAAFGLVYLGGVQYSIYVPIFSRLFPNAASYAAAPLSAKLKDAAGARNLVAQVILDQFVHHPLMYFPAFYCLKELVQSGVSSESVGKGLAKYSTNYQEDLFALWKLWVPSTFINFAFMPMHLRIPWVASTSLIWTCILSYMRGDDDIEMSSEDAMNYVGAQGRPLATLYDLGVSAKPAYLYDRSKEHLLVTATGRDRIGFIHNVSERIMGSCGNIVDVKAYKVGREFVTIMLVEVEPSNVDSLQAGLNGLLADGLTVAFQTTQPWLNDTDEPRCKNGVTFTGALRATGPDQPGIIRKLTELLADLGLDIASLACHQHFQVSLQRGDATQLCQISGVVRAFSPIDRSEIEQKLSAFEGETGIRIGLTETAPDPSFSPLAPDTSKAPRKSLVRTMTGSGAPLSGSSKREGK